MWRRRRDTIQNVRITRSLVYGSCYSGIRFVGGARSAIGVERNAFDTNGLDAGGGSPSETDLDDVGSAAGTMMRRNILSVGVALLNCCDAAPRGFGSDDNVVCPARSFPACVAGAAAVDPAFIDAAGADFHPTATAAMAYGAYAR